VSEFYTNHATRYLLAWEENGKIVKGKSKCTTRAQALIMVAVIAFFCLLFTVAPILASGP